MFKSILISLLLLLVGCATKPVVQERVVYQFIKVPFSLTEKVRLSAPPEAEFYSTQPPAVQESLLFDVIAQRTKEIGVCNSRLTGIDNWSAIQAKIYLGTVDKKKE